MIHYLLKRISYLHTQQSNSKEVHMMVVFSSIEKLFNFLIYTERNIDYTEQ